MKECQVTIFLKPNTINIINKTKEEEEKKKLWLDLCENWDTNLLAPTYGVSPLHMFTHMPNFSRVIWWWIYFNKNRLSYNDVEED